MHLTSIAIRIRQNNYFQLLIKLPPTSNLYIVCLSITACGALQDLLASNKTLGNGVQLFICINLHRLPGTPIGPLNVNESREFAQPPRRECGRLIG